MKGVFVAVLGAAVVAGSAFAARYEATSMSDALRVRDAIRADRASGKIAADESVTVVFKPGEYVLDATLALEAVDSGTEKAPVTWCAEKPGSVRFFGGRRIPLSAFRPVADAATRKRLGSSACDAVRVCDVMPYLVKDAKPWPDKITGVLPGPWLYVDGEPQTVARWPNADAPEKGWFGFTKNVEKGSPTTPGAFEFPGDRAERWDFAKGVWMLGYWRFDWHCECLKMASYDAKTHVMRTAGFPTWKIGDGKEWPFYKRRIHAVNLLEELDLPGEWHLDVAAKRLYWYPPKDVSERTEIVLAQALGPFVTMNGTKHVVLTGLNFEYSHGGAVVDLKGTTDCRVQDCTIANHAGLAIGILGTHNRITRTTIRNIGARAIHLQGGNERALLPANNLVDSTVIEGYAMFQRTMAAGMLIEGCGQAVRDCVFRNAPYIAIGYHGNEHLIADCEFDHVVQEAGDSGCIYSGHNASNLGTIIFGNHIHDLAKTPAECSGRSGIYFDDCDWGDDVIGNTLENVGLGILIGGGKLHGVYNNLFKGGKRGVHVDGRGVNWRWRGAFCWWSDGKSFCQYRHRERNIDPDGAPWAVAYPQLSRAMYDRPQYPLLNVIEGNRFAGCAKPFECGDRDARRSLGERLDPSNVVTTNAPTGDLVAPQPIRLKDAVRNALASADGSVTAVVSLDVSAHLSWTLSDGARRILARSPLGVTVDDFDFGRRVVPGAAQSLGEVPLKAFTNGTHIVKGGNGDTVKPAVTNMPAFASLTARAWRIPLKSLITGKEVASLEVRLWSRGAAFRWTVPGEGRHFIRGENSAFVPGGDKAVFKFIEWERDADYENGYAEACPYPRAKSVTGLVFPNAPRGWEHTGEVVTPWRGLVW